MEIRTLHQTDLREYGKYRRTMGQSTQILYKLVALPMMSFASEIWAVNGADKRKIVYHEMRFLLPVAEYTKRVK
jgi:hypothetical protein